MQNKVGRMWHHPSKKTSGAGTSREEQGEWLVEMSEPAFRAHVEYLYHALQLPAQQAEAFATWQASMGQAIDRWRRQQAETLLEVIEQLVEEGEPFLSPGSEPYGRYLLWSASSLKQDIRWQEAQDALEKAAQVFERMGNQVDYATTLNNLAALYYAQGNYAQAEPLLKRALAIYEQVLGPQHPDTAGSLNNLAELYRAQGNYAQAEPLYQRALAICEQVLGPQHPNTASSLNNLAALYYAQGNYAQAEPLLKRALAICEQVLGPQHPDTATSLNNLALLYDAQGNYEQAEPLYQRALAIWEQVLGPQHPATAGSLNNLALLYRAQGNYAQAEPLMKHALAICEQVLGPQHPDTATIRANYTFLLEEMTEQKTEGAGSQDESSQPQ